MKHDNAIYDTSYNDSLAPEPTLTVSEWADQYRHLSQRSSAEPGRWRTERTPYLREIMDSLSASSPVETVVLMKGAQVGGTECGNNWMGYVIDNVPGPMMAVQPTVEMAKRVSKQRLAPLLEESPRLRDKVKSPRSRDSGNTILTKEFTGGVLILTGANSAVGLRSMPVRYLFLDEVDGYPGDIDDEGDPVDLALGRTRTFARKKIFLVSTPTVANRSRIEQAFLQSDQRYYHIPCPHCDTYQPIEWSQLKWQSGDPDSVYLECCHCQAAIHEHHKTRLLHQGRWVASAPEVTHTRGYHLSGLYSPLGWFSWVDAVRLYEAAQDHPTLLRVFVNTVLGQTWQEQGDAPDWRRLYERRESYPVGTVPESAVLLTAGVDVQGDRLECSVVGWWHDEAWIIDHVVIPGDPATEAPWKRLDTLLASNWSHSLGGELRINTLMVDSGYLTKSVYHWVSQHDPHRVLAIKGQDHLQAILGRPRRIEMDRRGKPLKRGCRLWPVGVSVLKTDIYRRLRLDHPTESELEATGFPATYIHFPELSEEYCKQLTAEHIVKRIVKGYARYQWEKLYERNEALDCLVYAMAAYHAAGAHRFDDEQWNTLRADLQTSSASLPTESTDNLPGVRRRRSTFWNED